uniref:Methionine aminopeptidase 1 n=1 Tax=Rhizophora mucronata TaxID=61149 RepID=A0A2P2JM60_RHIMU
MEYGPYTMPNKTLHHTITIFFSMLTNSLSNLLEASPIFANSYTFLQALFSHLHKIFTW